MSKSTFFGLDLETSGSDHRDHVPIQIGICAPSGATYQSQIGKWRWHDQGGAWVWSDEAARVHGISRIELLAAPSVVEVDLEASEWVKSAANGVPVKFRHMVGWNVAGFDRPFIDRHLPQTARQFSYRTVDLNAIVFSLVESGMKRPTGKFWKYDDLKKEIKRRAAEMTFSEMGMAVDWHDAEYDAAASLMAFRVVTKMMRQEWR